ncbi:putative capsid protein [Hubei hepe-like virus 3]|uniref:putative capsid protein n=1 Tax=Hubei hepe-like virus 3 TaxID=1922896 RepID=UPI00090A2A44|nr:putative capsid protein [Hubei hepe-like virus 3]APG77801.1 putative capsid protein [Hubei hepe-like virus 3]
MSGRFQNRNRSISMRGGGAKRTYNQRRPKPAPKRKQSLKGSFNQPRRGETIISGRMYVGPLTAAGLAISVGPNNQQFAGEKLVTNALTYNQYRPLSATVMYQPLVNQTQGQAIINTWMTSDSQEGIPADDTVVKRTMTSAKGTSWFSTQSRNYKAVLPQTQFNSYPTGANGGTTYQDACRIIIKPTSADTAITNYGDVYLMLTIAVSSPVPPPTTSSFANSITIQKEVWLTGISTPVINGLILTKYSTRLGVATATTTNIFDLANLTGSEDLTVPSVKILDAVAYYFTEKTATATPTYQTTQMGTNYQWDTTQNTWRTIALMYQQRLPVMTQVVNNVVPSDNQTIWDIARQVAQRITARAVPITNNVDDEGGEIPLEINVQNQPIQVKNEVNEQEETQPLLVDVNNQPTVSVKNVLNQENNYEPLLVTQDQNDPMKVLIEQQPVQVYQQRTTSDWIEDIASTIGKILLADSEQSHSSESP